MHEKEAREIIKKYVLENFDDRWHTEPLFFEEYYDLFTNTLKPFCKIELTELLNSKDIP